MNAARGGVVDDAAMADAVNSGRIRAASDVFENEPKASDPTIENCLTECDGFYGTHHIGASTQQAQDAVADEVLRLVSGFRQDGTARNAVNVTKLPTPTGQLHVRNLDRVGVLAHVFEVLRRHDLNVAMRPVFDGAGAAVAKITLSAKPDQNVMDAIVDGSANVLGLL